MSAAGRDAPWPVIVKIGRARTAALMNRKAFQKSLESGTPWIVHPATGRVLPWPDSPALHSLTEGPGHFVLALEDGASPQPYGNAPPPETDPDSRAEMGGGGAAGAAAGGDVLSRLAEVISRRRKEMPEGSYTTHLFRAGPGKVRKKLGEEAVELILAEEPKDVVYEAADLVYHIQVLLTVLDLDWSEVRDELARRHSGGG